MNETDVYLQVKADGVIQSCSLDIANDEKWMKEHGFFISELNGYYPKYANPMVNFDGMMFNVALSIDSQEYDYSNGKRALVWKCWCNNDLLNVICTLSFWMNKIYDGAHVRYITKQERHSFDVGSSRAEVMQILLANWIVNSKQTGKSPQEAFEKYCMAMLDAIEKVKQIACGNERDKDFWNTNWTDKWLTD